MIEIALIRLFYPTRFVFRELSLMHPLRSLGITDSIIHSKKLFFSLHYIFYYFFPLNRILPQLLSSCLNVLEH
jgi:hypothetical protein